MKEDVFDFLMTYGWSILVVLVAIGALMYFGRLLNTDAFYPSICSCENTDYQYTRATTQQYGITYFECYNLTRHIDFDKQKILFNASSRLFYCSDNNTMIAVT